MDGVVGGSPTVGYIGNVVRGGSTVFFAAFLSRPGLVCLLWKDPVLLGDYC